MNIITIGVEDSAVLSRWRLLICTLELMNIRTIVSETRAEIKPCISRPHLSPTGPRSYRSSKEQHAHTLVSEPYAFSPRLRQAHAVFSPWSGLCGDFCTLLQVCGSQQGLPQLLGAAWHGSLGSLVHSLVYVRDVPANGGANSTEGTVCVHRDCT